LTTNIDLANKALIRVGHNTLLTLTDARKSARIINSNIEDWKDEVFKMHNWNELKTRANLAADPTAPLFEFDRKFQLPSDLIHLMDVYLDEEWIQEGNFILTNAYAPLQIRYIRRPDGENIRDPGLIDALVSKIAYEIVESLTQNRSKRQEVKQHWQDVQSMAKKRNSMENSPKDNEEDPWLTVRY